MSMTFESDPLLERFEILGHPRGDARDRERQPNALVMVRLCEVTPDGQSTLVTRALQNLTHRDSDEAPSPLEPGKRYSITVKLDARGHAFAAGNKIRLGISPTYWPWAWPSPEAATLTDHDRREQAAAAGAAAAARSTRSSRSSGSRRRRPPMPTELLEQGPSGPHAHPRPRDGPPDAAVQLGRRRHHAAAQRPRVRRHQRDPVRHRRGRPAVGRGALPHVGQPGARRLEDSLGVDPPHEL